MRTRVRGEQGIALVIAVMSMMLMTALGTALVLTTMTEAGISSSYVDGIQAFYAADAAVERVMSDLPAVGDWSSLVGVHTDGPAEPQVTAPDAPHIRVLVSVSSAEVEGAIVVRAEAYGAGGLQRTVEATVARTGEVGPAAVRLIAWREIR